MRLPHVLRSGSTVGPSSAPAVTSFEYQPLEDSHIRIVYLQPRRAKRPAEEIECILAHVAFGYPEYKALSYAWGDGTIKKPILLNGIRFEVNETLATALINIRGLESAKEMPQALWVDAICINQAEDPKALEERNRQVRLMPLIYQRAQMVLVWLGTKETFKVHCDLENKIRSQGKPKHARGPFTSYELFRIPFLCRRPYWQRLWIIQEVGKARLDGLRIHYDHTTVGWDKFIGLVEKERAFANSVPVLLNHQRKDRFSGGGHTFSNLLKTNEHALCKNPRDKIYGFVGLAIDIRIDKFPIDYAKSPFEVVADTIFFLNRDESNKGRSQDDILEMFRLLGRRVGGGRGLEPPPTPVEVFSAGTISLNTSGGNVRYLRIPGRLVGRIKEVGPLYCDYVARTEKWSEWQGVIWNNILDFNVRTGVLEQSERFLEVLERFDDVSQKTIFAFDRSITWEEIQQQSSIKFFEQHRGSNIGNTATDPLDYHRHGSRLFLLEPRVDDLAPIWMGLAPLGTQAGDFVCQFAGIERAVIIRQSASHNSSPAPSPSYYTYELIGCAGLSRDTNTAKKRSGTDWGPHQLFPAGMSGSLTETAHFNTYMDIRTAWEISSFC